MRRRGCFEVWRELKGGWCRMSVREKKEWEILICG